MTTIGLALQMRHRLAKLADRHGYIPKAVAMPLAPPADGPMTVIGLAATTDTDLGRQRFRAYAFTNLCLSLKGYEPWPRLLWKHQDDQIAGEIQALHYDDVGNLRIRADVDHPMARRATAFSVGARVLEYEIKNADTPDYYALISKAELTEISVTDCPANPRALVLTRSPAAPLQPFLDAQADTTRLAIRGIGIIAGMLDKIRIMQAAAPSPRPAPAKSAHAPNLKVPRTQVEPHRASEFGRLISQLEELHP